MKRIIITIAAVIAIMGAAAQNKNVNISKQAPKVEQVTKTKKAAKSQGTPNGWKYPTKDGKFLPVMVGSKGGWYVDRISKDGNAYRMYLNDKQKAKCVK